MQWKFLCALKYTTYLRVTLSELLPLQLLQKKGLRGLPPLCYFQSFYGYCISKWKPC